MYWGVLFFFIDIFYIIWFVRSTAPKLLILVPVWRLLRMKLCLFFIVSGRVGTWEILRKWVRRTVRRGASILSFSSPRTLSVNERVLCNPYVFWPSWSPRVGFIILNSIQCLPTNIDLTTYLTAHSMLFSYVLYKFITS